MLSYIFGVTVFSEKVAAHQALALGLLPQAAVECGDSTLRTPLD